MQTLVYEIAPQDFIPKVHVAASYLNVDGRLLLLQLSSLKPEAGAWGVPAGKFEPQEMPVDAARRELFEETGIQLDLQTPIKPLGQLYMRKPGVDYVYHMFSVNLNTLPEIQLSDEHCKYEWVSFNEAQGFNLMKGGLEALHTYLKSL